eukprot:TRINITY_DN21556_c0_g1_i1.p1 TRINITY_DN21556_c0_g1~~TRINITY_DN21556_c0_g1_i1.p1  ORF type:complete len:343 (+),score=54.00 TRINITY_DN21556_c0_g1_i1:68-1096(+)
MVLERVRLPAKGSDIELSTPLGIGTNKWEDDDEKRPKLIECAAAAATSGSVMFDTAEVYVKGQSEVAVGNAMKDAATKGRIVVATKHFPLLWHFNAKKAVQTAVASSLQRLQLSCIDLYYLHMANTAIRPLHAYADALADEVDAGRIKAVGVSNFSDTQLRQFHARLAQRGIPLAAHQVEFSLARCAAEASGMLETCRELDVKVVAWAPLGGGSGRLTTSAFERLQAGNPVEGLSDNAAQLLREVGAVAESHDATVEQVAIAWILRKGAICLLGTRSKEHAISGFKALDLKLSDADMKRLDAAALLDDGMYKSMFSGNVVTRFLANRVLVPLLQDPLPASRM